MTASFTHGTDTQLNRQIVSHENEKKLQLNAFWVIITHHLTLFEFVLSNCLCVFPPHMSQPTLARVLNVTKMCNDTETV